MEYEVSFILKVYRKKKFSLIEIRKEVYTKYEILGGGNNEQENSCTYRRTV